MILTYYISQIKAAVANTLAAQAVSQTVAQAIAHAVEPAQDALTLQAAQQAMTVAEKELDELKIKQAHLSAIVATSKALHADSNGIDQGTLGVQEAVKKELADAFEAQQQVIKVTEKRIAEAAAGHL